MLAGFANYDAKSPLLTPFFFDSHKDVSPTYVQVAGIDPWRDGGVIYAEELSEVGVQTRLDVYKGLPHCWWTTFPMITPCRTRVNDMIKGFEWLLGTGSGARERL